MVVMLMTVAQRPRAAVSSAGLIKVASIACGLANSGLLPQPAAPAASDKEEQQEEEESLLDSSCAEGRRSLALTVAAGSGAGACILLMAFLTNK